MLPVVPQVVETALVGSGCSSPSRALEGVLAAVLRHQVQVVEAETEVPAVVEAGAELVPLSEKAGTGDPDSSY